MKKSVKILLFSGMTGAIVLVLFIIYCNVTIELFAKDRVYSSAARIPASRVGVLLGTSKRSRRGRTNLYFLYRIRAALRLYRQKKIRYIIVSGDNATQYYNEPVDMKKELVRRGFPKKAIIMDFAGFRTLDSVVRARKVFGQKRITVISQEFHNKRAIFIASHFGIDAIGYNARDVDVLRQRALKVKIREVLARTWVFLDLYIFNTQPKFLGREIRIPR